MVRAFIHDGKRVLVGRKRRDIPHPLMGCWHIVGGRLEYGESAWNAVAREVKEEVGLDLKPIRIIDAYQEFLEWPRESGIPSQHTLYIVFECIPEGGELRAGDDVEKVKWIDIDEIHEYLSRDSLLKSPKLLEFINQLRA